MTEVVSLVKVHNHLSLRINRLDGIITGIDVSGKVSHVLRGTACYLQGSIAILIIPKHSVGGLVTYLYPLYVDTSCLQGIQNILGMIGNRLLHLLEVIVLPGSRNPLLGWVCPGIRVVEVNHQSHTELLSSPCLRHYIILSVPSILRIYPYTKTDGVHAEVAEKRHALSSLTISIIELLSVLLHLCNPTYIGSLGEATHIVCLLLFGSGIIIIAATRARNRKQERCSQQYGFS